MLMSKKLSIEEIKGRIPKHITIDETTYKDTQTKCRFWDEKYGEFWTIPSGVFRNHGHVLRGKEKSSKKFSKDIQYVKDRLPEYLSIVEETYVNLSNEAVFIDVVYGTFTTLVDEVV